jgi:hypothetical protein
MGILDAQFFDTVSQQAKQVPTAFVLVLAGIFPETYSRGTKFSLCPAIMHEYQTNVTAGTVAELTQHR